MKELKTIKVVNRKKQEFKIIVDSDDYEYLSQFTWNVRIIGNNYYARRFCKGNLAG